MLLAIVIVINFIVISSGKYFEHEGMASSRVTDNNYSKPLVNYLSTHPERNLQTAQKIQVELDQIKLTCATRDSANLNLSCNNFLLSYQSVLAVFFTTNATSQLQSNLSLTELEKRVDNMLSNCNVLACYNKIGLFNAKINQLLIDEHKDLLVITGNIKMNEYPSV